MISFDSKKGRFSFRSVAVVIHDGHILIHRVIADDFWALPGGRVEFFETSVETVVREIAEELGLQSTIERHLWHIENFFEYKSTKYHEIANFFLVKFAIQPDIESEIDFKGIETSVDLLFRWVPLDKIETYNLKPVFLIKKINDLPSSIETIRINELNV